MVLGTTKNLPICIAWRLQTHFPVSDIGRELWCVCLRLDPEYEVDHTVEISQSLRRKHGESGFSLQKAYSCLLILIYWTDRTAKYMKTFSCCLMKLSTHVAHRLIIFYRFLRLLVLVILPLNLLQVNFQYVSCPLSVKNNLVANCCCPSDRCKNTATQP